MAQNLIMTSDASKILDVSAERVRQLERAGDLHAIKTPKGMRLFKREEVERLAESRRNSHGR